MDNFLGAELLAAASWACSPSPAGLLLHSAPRPRASSGSSAEYPRLDVSSIISGHSMVGVWALTCDGASAFERHTYGEQAADRLH